MYISPSMTIKSGTFVDLKAIVNVNSVVVEGCIVLLGVIIDHDR